MTKKLSKDRIVTSFNGKKVKRSECKKIKNDFYIVGDPTIFESGECYLVEGKYHRFNNDQIEYDYNVRNYVLVHKNHLKHGLVDITEDGEPIMGYFSSNLSENVNVLTDGTKKSKVQCISEEVAKKLGYREQYNTGIFLPRDKGNANFFKKIGKSPINKSDLPYDSRFSSELTKKQYDNHYNPKYDNENLNRLGDFLEKNGITFGVEFETTYGYIPERLCYKYGLISLRDGSIQGIEYVTVPYSGRKGLYALKKVCEELGKRTKFDNTCALHLHLGGLDRNMTQIMSSYILGYLVQNDMFSLQPAYKKGTGGVKGKEYCRPLDTDLFKSMSGKINNHNILDEFKKLFLFISDGTRFSDYNNNLTGIKGHPSDPSGTRKWNIQSRYRWLNFVPIVFGNKQTLEFRHHNGTFNFEKVINFLFNCATFIKLAKSEKENILNIDSKLRKSLEMKTSNECSLEILNDYLLKNYNPELINIVNRNNEYNSIRKGIMRKLTQSGDVAGNNEMREENSYNTLTPNFWE